MAMQCTTAWNTPPARAFVSACVACRPHWRRKFPLPSNTTTRRLRRPSVTYTSPFVGSTVTLVGPFIDVWLEFVGVPLSVPSEVSNFPRVPISPGIYYLAVWVEFDNSRCGDRNLLLGLIGVTVGQDEHVVLRVDAHPTYSSSHPTVR